MKVGIIGGGVCGLFTAYYLHQAGAEVTVLERGDFAEGCSLGNAGMIVPSHIVPLAAPGMVAKGLRWLLNPRSPFYIKPRFSQDLLRWGWLFFKSATGRHVQQSIPTLRDLSLLSKQLYQALQHRQLFDFGWTERGLLMLYQTAAAEHEEHEVAHLANRAGILAQPLAAREVQALEPAVEVRVRGGVLYPGDAHLAPQLLLAGLRQHLAQQGVQLLPRQSVADFEIRGNAVRTVTTATDQFSFDEIVVAGGAWSGTLAQKLGLNLPLQGGKGYSFMLADAVGQVSTPAILLEARATATPMGRALRFAGTMEIAGTDLSVNLNRVQGIVQGVNRFYPSLQVKMPTVNQVWRGLRPCSPDGLPYIGRLAHLKNVTLATGHGMMGLSLGPVTGKLAAELVLHQPASLACLPHLSVARFA